VKDLTTLLLFPNDATLLKDTIAGSLAIGGEGPRPWTALQPCSDWRLEVKVLAPGRQHRYGVCRRLVLQPLPELLTLASPRATASPRAPGADHLHD
jgi:hypothetical protein